MRQKRRRAWMLLLFFYLIALLAWLAAGAVSLAIEGMRTTSGALPQRQLAFEDFTLVGLATVAEHDNWLVSTDTDPQLVYTPAAPVRVSRLEFSARPLNKAPGEMTLYYTTRPGEGFSDAKKLWAQRLPDGSWYFDLGGRQVTALRLDPDTAGGVIWQVEGIVLNAPRPWLAHFLPGAGVLFLLVALPPLAWAAVSEVIAFLSPVFARRRLHALFEKSRPQ